MRKVVIYSILLILGLVGSQLVPELAGNKAGALAFAVKILTTFCLAYIMIHVGYEFEIDRSNLRQYAWDYLVAGTAAAFPWLFCAVYFVFLLNLPENWGSSQTWKESLLAARFAAPTSAGVLFSMLAAAGLSATWTFRKARVLAIFDDLDTVLLMIPLKMMMIGIRWQLGLLVVVMCLLLWAAYRFLHSWRIPVSWPWVLTYSAAITLACELIYQASKVIDDVAPIHFEVLLPAFVLGCMMARPPGHDPHVDEAREGHQAGPESASEQHVAAVVSACFMVLVGLSMPSLTADSSESTTAVSSPQSGWGVIALHVLVVTILINLGKMFSVFCYRREAVFRERLAVSIAMFPRGEVGAGVIVISLSYGITGLPITVAMLSLAINLVCTGLFIAVVRKLIAR